MNAIVRCLLDALSRIGSAILPGQDLCRRSERLVAREPLEGLRTLLAVPCRGVDGSLAPRW